MSDTEHATSGQSLTKKILTLAVLVGLPLAVVDRLVAALGVTLVSSAPA